MSNELFVLPYSLVQSIVGEPVDSEGISSMVDDMQEAGVFKLPYDKVDLRYVCNAGQLLLIQDLQVTGRVHRHFLTPGVRSPTFAAGTVCLPADMDPKLLEKYELTKAAASYCDVMAVALILALATVNTEKRTVENKRAKLGIGKRENRKYDRITYLSLPGNSSSDHADTGRTVRMHLRRGHKRNQHYGPGSAQIKLIWVAPVFVNADEEYIPRKEYQLGRRP